MKAEDLARNYWTEITQGVCEHLSYCKCAEEHLVDLINADRARQAEPAPTPSREQFIVQCGGDGAEAVLIAGYESVRVKVRAMLVGEGESGDEVTERIIADMDNPENWQKDYPDYTPRTWEESWEDGYIRVVRLSKNAGAEASSLGTKEE